jgi:hypothetical protein
MLSVMVQRTATEAKPYGSRPTVEGPSDMKHTTGEFDDLVLACDPRTTLRQPDGSELEALWRAASRVVDIPLAPPEVIARVIAQDPESMWLFETAGQVTGGFGLLHLTATGVERLRAGAFDPRDPDPELLVRAPEHPVGTYWWVGFKFERDSHGIAHLFQVLRRPRFAMADFWATPFTADGQRFASSVGFRPAEEPACPALYRYTRKANRTEPRDR